MCSLHLSTLAAIGAGGVSFDPLPTRAPPAGDKQRVLPSCPRHFEGRRGQAENRAGISAIATTRPVLQTSSLGNDPSGRGSWERVKTRSVLAFLSILLLTPNLWAGTFILRRDGPSGSQRRRPGRAEGSSPRGFALRRPADASPVAGRQRARSSSQ